MKLFNKKNILKHAVLEDAFPTVYSAKKAVPDWYRQAKRINDTDDGNTEKLIKSLPISHGFKYCSPFFEAITNGYMLPLSVDIAVEQTEGGPKISWTDPQHQYLTIRQDTNPTLPTPHGFAATHFTWMTQHMIKIPKGYSALFTHPLNRYDLPFLTMSGIVDGEYTMPHGNVPVFFNNTFEGIIPQGTPIAQIILFKTENWESEIDSTIMKQGFVNNTQSVTVASGFYKKNHWKKKKYD